MRWWFKRRAVPHEAIQAREEAEAELVQIHSNDELVDDYHARLRSHLEENHLAEAIMSAMQPRPKRRGLRHV